MKSTDIFNVENLVRHFERGNYKLAEVVARVPAQVSATNVAEIVALLPAPILDRLRDDVKKSPKSEEEWAEFFFVESLSQPVLADHSKQTDNESQLKRARVRQQYRNGIESLREFFFNHE